MSIEDRYKYIILGEESAESIQSSLVDYLMRLKREILFNINTNTPNKDSIISEVANIDISDSNRTVMILLYRNISIIEELLSDERINRIKNNNVKIISFNVISERISALNKSIYQNTYVVNGYYKDLLEIDRDLNGIMIEDDSIFICYLLLNYLEKNSKYFDDPPSFYISSLLSEFRYVLNGYEMKMSESNAIERRMYYGEINEEGRIVKVVDLESNSFESVYNLFNDNNYKLCINSEIVENKDTIRIGFISNKSFKDDYYYELYRGFEMELNNYNQKVLYIYIYIYNII